MYRCLKTSAVNQSAIYLFRPEALPPKPKSCRSSLKSDNNQQIQVSSVQFRKLSPDCLLSGEFRTHCYPTLRQARSRRSLFLRPILVGQGVRTRFWKSRSFLTLNSIDATTHVLFRSFAERIGVFPKKKPIGGKCVP